MKKLNLAIGTLLALSVTAAYADDSDEALAYKLLMQQQQLHGHQVQDLTMQHAHQMADQAFTAHAIEQIQEHKIYKLKEQMADHFAPAQRYYGQPSSPTPTYYPPNNPGAAIYPKQRQDYNPQTDRFETPAPAQTQQYAPPQQYAPAPTLRVDPPATREMPAPAEQPEVKLLPPPSLEEQKPLDENGVTTESVPTDSAVKQPIMFFNSRPVPQYQRVVYIQPRRAVYYPQYSQYANR